MANHLPSLSAVILRVGTVFRYGVLTYRGLEDAFYDRDLQQDGFGAAQIGER
jgi:hypothetical protein